jgi:hypothetical protein
MYFPYINQKGEAYIDHLLNKKFSPKNIFLKTDVKVNSVIEYEEVRDADIDDNENSEVNNIDQTIKQSKVQPKEISGYINSLKAAALHWYNTYNWINNNDLTYEESIWLDKLNRIGIAYFRPLVAVSFISHNVNSDDRVRLFKEIERFIFIAFRLGRAFSTYRNSEFYRLTRKFNNNYGYYDWNGLRYFLYEYELEKVNQFGNQKIDWHLFTKSEKDKVSIEHIYPQSRTNSYWMNSFKGYTENQRLILTNSLGNLLPLSSSINSSLQNDSFEKKKNDKINNKGEIVRRGYSNGSHSEIEVSKYDKWDAETIIERGIKLLTFMERRWDISFENDDVKKDLLFLTFVKQDTN